MIGDVVTVNALKYDGSVNRSWKCELAARSGSLIECVGVFDRDVVHNELGHIVKGTVSREYFWLDRWYNVFRFHEPDGTFRNYYCNINLPPTFSDGVLEYIDLDIDVVVWPDGSQQVLDRTEFEQSSRRFGYSADVHLNVERSLNELREMIRQNRLPR